MKTERLEDLLITFFVGVVLCLLLSNFLVTTIRENTPAAQPKAEVCRNEFGERIACK